MNSLISVVMPVYNAEKHLSLSIESVLNQSYSNFEFLIFNDGSTDDSYKIITSYNDDRIKVFNYEKNYGYVRHLNYGIEIAKGKYIARVDADDINDLLRFETQVNFMENNPKIGVCGAWFSTFTGLEKRLIMPPQLHDDIQISMLEYNSIAHPSTIIRKEVLLRHSLRYNEDFIPAEDYKLWVEMAKVSNLANIGKDLMSYRLHEDQISFSKKQKQKDNEQKIRMEQLEYLTKSAFGIEEFNLLYPSSARKEGSLFLLDKLVKKLIYSNNIHKVYNAEKFNQFLESKVYHAILSISEYKFSHLNIGLRYLYKQKLIIRLKFIIKCLIKYRNVAAN